MSAALKAAVVTGGAQGLGLAIARALAAEGRRVALVGTRDVAAGDRVAASLGPEHIYVRCDISAEAHVVAAMSDVRERIGPIEVLVNNAGVGASADAAELKEADWDVRSSGSISRVRGFARSTRSHRCGRSAAARS